MPPQVKNSWGASWGDNGYFYLKRGVNQCGITAMPSYPIECQPVNGGDPRGKPEEPLLSPADCPKPRNGDIKLTSYPAGNLLLHFEGAWHSLCSQHLQIETAELMCKTLGYTTAWSFSDRTIPTRDSERHARRRAGLRASRPVARLRAHAPSPPYPSLPAPLCLSRSDVPFATLQQVGERALGSAAGWRKRPRPLQLQGRAHFRLVRASPARRRGRG